MAALAIPAMVTGTVLSAGAELKAGRSAAARGRTQKVMNEVAATQVVAVGQRKALEEKRQAEIMASRAVAVAAAGGSPDDIDNLIADISSEGVYRANVAMYEAETESENLKYQGLMAEQIGKEEEKASKLTALSTVLKGGGAIASYG